MIDWVDLKDWYTRNGCACVRDGSYLEVYVPGETPKDLILHTVGSDDGIPFGSVLQALDGKFEDLALSFVKEFGGLLDGLLDDENGLPE